MNLSVEWKSLKWRGMDIPDSHNRSQLDRDCGSCYGVLLFFFAFCDKCPLFWLPGSTSNAHWHSYLNHPGYRSQALCWPLGERKRFLFCKVTRYWDSLSDSRLRRCPGKFFSPISTKREWLWCSCLATKSFSIAWLSCACLTDNKQTSLRRISIYVIVPCALIGLKELCASLLLHNHW